MNIKEALEMVKDGRTIILMDEDESAERIKKYVDVERDPEFAPYIYGENGEIKWGQEVIDIEAEFLEESEIEYD